MLAGTGCLRNDMIKRRNLQGKARIVMEFLTTSISAANCIASAMYCGTFQDEKDKFMQSGKKVFYNRDAAKNHAS